MFVTSRRGRASLVHEGFRYVFHRETRAGRQYRCWRKNAPHICQSLISLDEERRRIVIQPSLHNHGSDWGHIKALEVIEKIARKADERPNALASSIIREEMAHVDEEAVANLPKRTALKRKIERVHAKHRPPLPKSFDDMHALPEKYRTIEGKNWLLADTGGHDRQLIFSTAEGLRSLAMSSYWLADGTFKAAPRIAYQLYAGTREWRRTEPGPRPQSSWQCVQFSKSTFSFGEDSTTPTKWSGIGISQHLLLLNCRRCTLTTDNGTIVVQITHV